MDLCLFVQLALHYKSFLQANIAPVIPLAFNGYSNCYRSSTIHDLRFLFEDWQNMFTTNVLLDINVLTALIITSLFATAIAFLTQTSFQKYTTQQELP